MVLINSLKPIFSRARYWVLNFPWVVLNSNCIISCAVIGNIPIHSLLYTKFLVNWISKTVPVTCHNVALLHGLLILLQNLFARILTQYSDHCFSCRWYWRYSILGIFRYSFIILICYVTLNCQMIFIDLGLYNLILKSLLQTSLRRRMGLYIPN